MTSDISVQLLAIYSAHLRESISGLPGQLLTLVFARSVPLILLAMGVFYLWVYVRHTSVSAVSTGLECSQQEPLASALSGKARV
jgi:hypothetical protein